MERRGPDTLGAVCDTPVINPDATDMDKRVVAHWKPKPDGMGANLDHLTILKSVTKAGGALNPEGADRPRIERS